MFSNLKLNLFCCTDLGEVQKIYVHKIKLCVCVCKSKSSTLGPSLKEIIFVMRYSMLPGAKCCVPLMYVLHNSCEDHFILMISHDMIIVDGPR